MNSSGLSIYAVLGVALLILGLLAAALSIERTNTWLKELPTRAKIAAATVSAVVALGALGLIALLGGAHSSAKARPSPIFATDGWIEARAYLTTAGEDSKVENLDPGAKRFDGRSQRGGDSSADAEDPLAEGDDFGGGEPDPRSSDDGDPGSPNNSRSPERRPSSRGAPRREENGRSPSDPPPGDEESKTLLICHTDNDGKSFKPTRIPRVDQPAHMAHRDELPEDGKCPPGRGASGEKDPSTP